MKNIEKKPIVCRECGKEFCVPCGQFAAGSIDWKTREGVCKKCEKPK